MPGIAAIVNAISADVVAKLAAANYPPLADGAILIGRVHVDEQVAPPRIIFIPRGSRFAAMSRSSAANASSTTRPGSGVRSVKVTSSGQGYATPPAVAFVGGGGTGAQGTAVLAANGAVIGVTMNQPGSGYTSAPSVSFSGGGGSGASALATLEPVPELRAAIQQRALLTEIVQFEVRVFAQAATPDPVGDFDATQAYYQQVIASTHLLAAGRYAVTSGVWEDSKPGNTQVDVLGREFVFGLELATPVLDQLVPYAPTGTASNAGVWLQPPDGSAPEEAIGGI